MIKCDTVKIKANYKYLLKTISKFNSTYDPKTGFEKGRYFNSKDISIPYNIYIATDFYRQTLTIEFSSKILLNNYPLLISKNTIRQCLENLNNLNICEFDIDGILDTGCFTKLHITRDEKFELEEKYLTALNDNVNNYRRFNWNHYIKQGIDFTSNVKGQRNKRSITIYDKAKEIIATAQNRQFLSLLDDPDSVINYFNGIVRFEIKLNSTDKIKDYLNLENTYIKDVLETDINPILTIFDEIFDSTKQLLPEEIQTYDEWAMSAIVEKYGGDMKLIEQDSRKFYSLNSRATRSDRLKKIETVKAILDKGNGKNLVAEIRKLLTD